MDIPRKDLVRKRRIRRIIYSVVAVVMMGAITFGLSRLEPASPTVDGSPFIDTVKRGDMVLDVRGLGTLVPENILLVPARDQGRVEQRYLLPGEQVEPDTILFRLSNPQLEQDVFDTEVEIRAAEADYANLEVQLETETLSQRVNASSVESSYEQAQTEFMAQKQMAEKGLTDQVTLTKARVMAEQLKTSVQLEKERAAIREKAVQAQLAASRARIEQQKRLLELRKEKLGRLIVRAGTTGVLQQLEVEVGEVVSPGAALARISDPRYLKAELRIAETQAKDITFGQKAEIDTRNGVIPGTVMRIDPAALEGTVTVDVRLEGDLPKGARPDLSVDGRIILDHLVDVAKVGRPVYAQPDATISLFRVEPDGIHASRVQVSVGRTSVNEIEIRQGLQPGDRVILSDMSAMDAYDRVRLE